MSNFNIIKLDAIASTNDELKLLHRKGVVKDGTVLWAKHQYAGRGQREKKWISEENKCLTFSIYKVFEPPLGNGFSLSKAVTVGLFRALQELSVPNLEVKWPNDILSANSKIGGILIENFYRKKTLFASVIGIGLNINQEVFENLPEATSLFLKCQKKYELDWVLEIVLNHLKYPLDRLIEEDAFFHTYFEKKLWRKNQLSEFSKGKETFIATPIGITESGALRVLDENDNEKLLYSHSYQMKYKV